MKVIFESIGYGWMLVHRADKGYTIYQKVKYGWVGLYTSLYCVLGTYILDPKKLKIKSVTSYKFVIWHFLRVLPQMGFVGYFLTIDTVGIYCYGLLLINALSLFAIYIFVTLHFLYSFVHVCVSLCGFCFFLRKDICFCLFF